MYSVVHLNVEQEPRIVSSIPIFGLVLLAVESICNLFIHITSLSRTGLTRANCDDVQRGTHIMLPESGE